MRTTWALIGTLLTSSAMAQASKDAEFEALFGSWVQRDSSPSEPGIVQEQAKGSIEPRDWAPWWLTDRQPQQFGDWYVWQGTGASDRQVGHIILTRTRWKNEGRFGPFFGFRVFEGNRAIALTAGTIPVDPRSPNCVWRDVTYVVDGRQARYLVDPIGGNCDKVSMNGQAVQRLQAGKEALIRVQGHDMLVSLKGFSAALRAAQKR